MINKINQKASTIARILAVLASYVRRFKRDNIELIFISKRIFYFVTPQYRVKDSSENPFYYAAIAES